MASKKVLLGISGGVDSAVAASILIKQGYDVTGAFMRNWDSTANNDIVGNPTIDDYICPQEQDYNDAKAVCKQLGIDILRVDFIKEYWDNVFTYFINEYKLGRTPNPDILCNKFIKFDQFLVYAIELGYDYIAMGHYCGVKHTAKGSYLTKAKDTNKDQTYFLAQLNQYQISKALFPLADYTKSEIRKMAQDLNLVVATKKDSTGICFIGERNFKEFLSNYIPAQPGQIIDYKTRKEVGKHVGVMYYTIGQSKGLGIGGQKDFDNGKWYVMGKDLEKKIIFVSNDHEQEYLVCDKVFVNDIILNNDDFIGKTKLNAKFRYRQQEYPVEVEWISQTTAFITAKDLPLGITIGQACVFYDEEYCCGGGTIDKIYLNGQEVIYE